ncbi:hypothetical protein PVAP13_1KG181485 [Panicum virgatum]|uniref:Uncharacterized protein n=1 Tax=Panicum virgatum TaxID=38727 RepID=A0A8T0XDB8_PANVG|nr:hypothetical protein PVAP13_1KG181485 [Panicum virgatum]
MRAKTQKYLSNRSLILPPTDEAASFPPFRLSLVGGPLSSSHLATAATAGPPATPRRFPRRPRRIPGVAGGSNGELGGIGGEQHGKQ